MAVIPKNVSNLVLTGGEQLAQQIAFLGPGAVTNLTPREGEVIIVRRIVAANSSVNAIKVFIYHDRDGTVADTTTRIFAMRLEGNAGTKEPTTPIRFDILVAQPTETISVAAGTGNVANVTFYGTRLQT